MSEERHQGGSRATDSSSSTSGSSHGGNTPQHAPYSSPISGFLTLFEDDSRATSSGGLEEGGENDEEGGDQREDNDALSLHDVEEESLSLDSLGLQVGPFRLPRELSTVTLKGVSARDAQSELDWDEDEAEDGEQEADRSDGARQLGLGLPLSMPSAQSIRIASSSQHSSLTWSASSKAGKAASGALQLGQEEGGQSPPSLSCSLPTPNLHLQRNVVSESWDEDFLFQDAGAEERDNSPRASLRTRSEKQRDDSPSKWNEMDDEEEDWNAALISDLKSELPRSTSGATIHSSKQDRNGNLSNFDHLERDSSHHGRRGALDPLRSRPMSMQISSQSVHASTPSTASTVDQKRHSALSSHRSDPKRDLKRPLEPSDPVHGKSGADASVNGTHRLSGEEREILRLRDRKHSAARTGANRQESQIPSLPGTPAKEAPRDTDGHWTHFLSSRLGYPKSPDSKRRERLGDASEVETSPNSSPTSTSSPSVHPSVSPGAKERSVVRSLTGRSAEKDATRTRADQRRRPHRKGAGSLSMSFGIPSAWNRVNRSSSKVGEMGRSLEAASSSSLSLASIIADAGRPEPEPALTSPMSFAGAVDEIQRTPGKLSNAALRSKSSSSTISSSGPLSGGIDGRANKRKLSAADEHKPLQWKSLDGTEQVDTVRTLRSVPRAGGQSGRSSASPSSREPFGSMMNNPSNSGSTTTATSAFTSSDCTTSAGSMTEQSTLYGSNGDRSSLASPHYRTYQPYSQRTSSTTSIPSESGASRKEEKVVRKIPSARRIRVATASPAAVKGRSREEGRAGEGSRHRVQSATESQTRLPSLPASASSAGKRVGELDPSYERSADSFSRRNSLGDLKIPSRITKAQEGIRENMTRVRDFALGIEELKVLRQRYQDQLSCLHPADKRRLRMEEEFGNWWECAEVLIGLGEGRGGEDDEANVSSLQQSPPPRSDRSLSTRKQTDWASRTPSLASNEQSQATVIRSGRGSQTASSRASSSRSIDPQREMDILAAMLAGTPLEDISPSRSGWSSGERAMSVSGASFDQSPPSGTDVRRGDAQGQMEMAASSTTSLTFAQAPTLSRSKFHRSGSLYRTGQYNGSEKRSQIQGSTSSLIPGTISTESVNTQGALRRSRLRSSGKAGLQGLRELLRAFKMNSTVMLNPSEASQSRHSLFRTLTNESRITLDEANMATISPGSQHRPEREGQSKRLSITRSLFGKSIGQSPSSLKLPLPAPADGTETRDSPSQEALPFTTGRRDVQRGEEGKEGQEGRMRRTTRYSSGAGSSTQDTSVDSDWTQGDFDNICIEDASSTVESQADIQKAPLSSAPSSRKRFFLFSKGFPLSANRRQSGEVVNWSGAENASTESIPSSLRRQSLQIPPRAVYAPSTPSQHSPPGMPRSTSNSRHPLLMGGERRQSGPLLKAEDQNQSRPNFSRRSASASSAPPSGSPTMMMMMSGQGAKDRPSAGSTAATVGYTSTSSNTSSAGTQTATASVPQSGQRYRDRTASGPARRLTLSSPRQASAAESTTGFRKLALKPEAIPSLLVYLDSTKARCQDSLAILADHPS